MDWLNGKKHVVHETIPWFPADFTVSQINCQKSVYQFSKVRLSPTPQITTSGDSDLVSMGFHGMIKLPRTGDFTLMTLIPSLFGLLRFASFLAPFRV